jgi:hypothetical protein
MVLDLESVGILRWHLATSVKSLEMSNFTVEFIAIFLFTMIRKIISTSGSFFLRNRLAFATGGRAGSLAASDTLVPLVINSFRGTSGQTRLKQPRCLNFYR